MGMMYQQQQQQQQFQKVTISKHQSVFEARQMESFRTNPTAAGAETEDGEEHPPPLPYKKRHSKWSWAGKQDLLEGEN